MEVQKEKASFIKENRLIIVGGIISLIAILIALYLFQFNSLAFDVVTILSFVAMVVIFLIQKKMSNKQSEVLEGIEEYLSFEPIHFPKSIKKAIELIRRYNIKREDSTKKNEKIGYCLNIYTDVPGYAILSDNKLWNEFYKSIESLEGKFPIRWHFYSDEIIKEHIKKQFSSWYSYDIRKIKEEIKSCTNNTLFLHCTGNNACTLKKGRKCLSLKQTECQIIQNLKNECDLLSEKTEVSNFIKKIEDNVIELHKIAIDQIKGLSNSGIVEIIRLNKNLPFFAWIILEEKQKQRKRENKEICRLVPIEGIISYTFFGKESAEREKGFKTKDSQLIKVLYEIVHYDTMSRLETIEK